MTKVTEIALEDDLPPPQADADQFIPSDAEGAAPDPAEAPPPARAETAGRPSRLAIVACGTAMFAAVTSITSVVIAGQATARAGELMDRVDAQASPPHGPDAPHADEEATPVKPASATASIDEATLRAALGDLRRDLARYSVANAQAGVPAIRNAQSEIVSRLGVIMERLNRIDDRLPKAPARP